MKHNYNKKLDIPQDADSARYFIPEGYTAKLEDGVLIVKPEESEDEKIMKAIIGLICENRYTYKSFTGVALDSMLAYLEKQKAKERLDRMAPIYNDKESFESALEKAWKYYNESASRTVDSFEDDYIECVFSKGFREGFLYKEKQKGQKPITKVNGEPVSDENYSVDIPLVEWSDEDEEALDMCLDAIPKKWKTKSGILLTKWLKDNIHPQPKQEWSEEDEKALERAIDCVRAWEIDYCDGDNSDSERLKSLKNRGNFPKSNTNSPSWSEEDKDFINMLILHFNYLIDKGGDSVETYKSYIEKLKSLRPHWKPSEEQMDALSCAKRRITIGGELYNILESLYSDLKKLM